MALIELGSAMDNEEFEQIPWSQLLAEADDGRRRTLYVIAGVVVALVVGAVAARSFRGPQATVVSLPEPAVASQVQPGEVATSIAPEAAAEPTPSSAPVVAPGPLSEADLMAVLPEEGTRAAVAAAEIFVIEYFTVDGASASAHRLAMGVPSNLDIEYPQDATSNGISYVEWARAVRSETIGDGLHSVTVAYGSVAAGAGEPMQRLPIRAVEVNVFSDEAGAARIHGLPRPVEFMPYRGADVEAAEAPTLVEAAALDRARMLGDEATVAAAYRVGDGWDVVVVIVDPASGHRWPLAFHVDE